MGANAGRGSRILARDPGHRNDILRRSFRPEQSPDITSRSQVITHRKCSEYPAGPCRILGDILEETGWSDDFVLGSHSKGYALLRS